MPYFYDGGAGIKPEEFTTVCTANLGELDGGWSFNDIVRGNMKRIDDTMDSPYRKCYVLLLEEYSEGNFRIVEYMNFDWSSLSITDQLVNHINDNKCMKTVSFDSKTDILEVMEDPTSINRWSLHGWIIGNEREEINRLVFTPRSSFSKRIVPLHLQSMTISARFQKKESESPLLFQYTKVFHPL